MRSKVGLIAYADRFGGDLAGLHALLNGSLLGLFGGVHVLPFYRPLDGADAGFDPEDHTEVDARLGSWADVSALSADYEVMADMIVKHVSSSSPQFQDWLARGSHPAFAGDPTWSGSSSTITMRWARGGDEAVLDADLATGSAEVTWTADGSRRRAPLAGLP